MQRIKANFSSLVTDLAECENTIFIVDDDESVRRSLRRLLQSLGFNVKAFASARDFLDHDCRGEGLLVLDKQMPEIDGIELQRMLLAQGNHIPVIFITAHHDADARDTAIESGAIAYLEKPFNEQMLLDAIDGWCAMNQSGPRPCPVRPS
jgi:two-component system, LuxR family, response regulator FixJ